MTDGHIIIIGAGAAGLMAAKELCEAGWKVTVLEARDYPGGRIHTIYNGPFANHGELGAEFVHGNLPITLGLFKEAGIPYYKTGGEMWHAKNGALKQEAHQIEYWDLFEEKLKALKEDTTLNAFLEEHFSDDQYMALRASARRYVSGFDTADPDKVSALALKDEWLNEDDHEQYRPTNGYQQMISYLTDKCTAHGCSIHMNTVVKQVKWEKNKVAVATENGNTYNGAKAIITVPLGVLQAKDDEAGAITCEPALPEIKKAVNDMAIGAIIKILLQFSEPFWEKENVTAHAGKSMEHMGFVFSEEEIIPTFWTQYPDKNCLLTGWLGGPKAAQLKDAGDEYILKAAIDSLAHIFNVANDAINQLLTAGRVINWTADIYSRGSYSYATVATASARKVLNQPVAGTIYFAGEALYEGPEMGTIEAALASGKDVAKKVPDIG